MSKRVPCISFVVPLYNEEASLAELLAGIVEHVSGVADDYEVIFVDDGSTDGSLQVLRELRAGNARVRVISFTVNHGKAEALDIGFRHARGDIVFTMDADLQDDPVEIPAFVAKLEEGYDLVSGWKVHRNDPWHKTLPSRFFNFVVSRAFGLRLHDFNCGYKAYRRAVARRLRLYGELHRFIPAVASSHGARITEIPVRHHARRFGRSKYGPDRLLKGFLDLVTVLVITRYLKRPLHLFGTIGLLSGAVGGSGIAYLAVLWLCGVRPIGNRPLLFYGILLVIVGVQLFSLGIVAELLVNFSHPYEGPNLREKTGFTE